MKILLLEDEYLLSRAICTYLLSNNYFVDAFDDGKSVLEAVKHQEYDLYILDINTPEVGGLECLEYINTLYPEVPKIMISAYHDIEYVSEAFGKGCSDYLKKPFNLQELQIRIEHLLKTKEIKHHKSQEQLYLSTHYVYDYATQMLYYDGVLEKFSKREYALIRLFVQNIGQVVNEESIRSVIWDDYNIEEATVRSLVNRVRKKLKEELIENVRGFGYIMKKKS